MLKYIKHHMESISGIEIYPLISLVIFFVFFSALIWYVITMKKEKVATMENYPLND